VYEERALGIQDQDEERGHESAGYSHLQKERSYIGEHMQQQLACVRPARHTAPAR
jgi:hypothetical protein